VTPGPQYWLRIWRLQPTLGLLLTAVPNRHPNRYTLPEAARQLKWNEKPFYNIDLRQPQGELTGGISIADDKISDNGRHQPR
jgi:hypothetical protein